MSDERKPLVPNEVTAGSPITLSPSHLPQQTGNTEANNHTAKNVFLPNHSRTNVNSEPPTSNFDTMMHLLKGNIGTGILAMADAFRNSGWLLGLFATLLMAVLCTHCMHILVNCGLKLKTSAILNHKLDYASVAEQAFLQSPSPTINRWATFARRLVNIFLVITQLGFCCVYFVFVAVNLQQFFSHYGGENVTVSVWLCAILAPMIALNLVRSLKHLAIASSIAVALTAFSLVITFFYLLQGLPATSSVRAIAPLSQLPLYFGTAIYAFEGIGVVLSLQNNMKDPEAFGGATGILNTGMTIVAALYTAVGFFGYLKYGEDTSVGSITLNLPPQDLLAECVRLLMAFAIFLSYGLQFYVPMNVLTPYLTANAPSHLQMRADFALRIALVFLTFFLALAIPNIGAVISLVGSVSSSMLALIFPPIIELVVLTRQQILPRDFFTVVIKDVALIVFGLLGFLFGSYTSILNIMNSSY